MLFLSVTFSAEDEIVTRRRQARCVLLVYVQLLCVPHPATNKLKMEIILKRTNVTRLKLRNKIEILSLDCVEDYQITALLCCHILTHPTRLTPHYSPTINIQLYMF